MENYLPYIVSVVCALISGFASYAVARKQSREDIKKLEKTYELDLEKEKEKHKMEIDKLQLEHKNQLALQQKQFETINEQIQNIAQKKDTLCRRMYN